MTVQVLLHTFLMTSLLVVLAISVGAETGSYYVNREWIKISINQNGVIELTYDVSITLDSGPDIDCVYISQPKSNFTIVDAFDQYGNKLLATNASSEGDYKVKVTLNTPLKAGEIVGFNITTNVARTLYEVTNIPATVAMHFTPTSWPAPVRDFRLMIVLPNGVTANKMTASRNWNNVLFVDGRLAVYWEKQGLSQNELYPVGVSFPKEYIQEYIRGIYIKSDGSVDPSTAPIQRKGDLYTLTGNITANTDGIVILRNNMTLDGTGFVIEGNGAYLISGTAISKSNNVTIKNTTIKGFYGGIYVGESSDNKIDQNSIQTNEWSGIYLDGSSRNHICDNDITRNFRDGISLSNSTYNRICNNNIGSNGYGIYVKYSQNNTLYGNNIIYNTVQVNIDKSSPSIDAWDGGYPSGGNYWSNYTGVDIKGGQHQDTNGSDGIGDTPHLIDGAIKDNYPLMGLFSDFNVTSEYHVQTFCNSRISEFHFNGTAISFNVSGDEGTLGFCRICIPTALMRGTFRVYLNNTEIMFTLLPFSNDTYSYLYVNYTHSTEQITIIPEFPTFVLQLLFVIATLMAVTVRKRKNR